LHNPQFLCLDMSGSVLLEPISEYSAECVPKTRST
jgi:hypothetical protein